MPLKKVSSLVNIIKTIRMKIDSIKTISKQEREKIDSWVWK